MKTLSYTTISLFILSLLCSCSGNVQQVAQKNSSEQHTQCPVGARWSILLQSCIPVAGYEVTLYADDAGNGSVVEIGVIFSDNQDQAELFLGKTTSTILEKNEQTLMYESSDQTYRLVQSKGIWVCTETPNENTAKSISIFASR